MIIYSYIFIIKYSSKNTEYSISPKEILESILFSNMLFVQWCFSSAMLFQLHLWIGTQGDCQFVLLLILPLWTILFNFILLLSLTWNECFSPVHLQKCNLLIEADSNFPRLKLVLMKLEYISPH